MMDFPRIVYEEYSNDCSDSDNVKRILEQINMQLMNQCCDNNTIANFERLLCSLSNYVTLVAFDVITFNNVNGDESFLVLMYDKYAVEYYKYRLVVDNCYKGDPSYTYYCARLACVVEDAMVLGNDIFPV